MRLGVLPQSVNRTFTIEDLKTATNNFSSSSFVGEGRHGKVRITVLPMQSNLVAGRFGAIYPLSLLFLCNFV